jgi:hypothetical protein
MIVKGTSVSTSRPVQRSAFTSLRITSYAMPYRGRQTSEDYLGDVCGVPSLRRPLPRFQRVPAQGL